MYRRWHWILCLVIVLFLNVKIPLLAETVASSQKVDPFVLLYDELSEPVKPITPPIVTPHIEWARPYHKGNVKVLFILEHDYQRDAVELAQRLSMDYKIISFRPYEALFENYGKYIEMALQNEHFDVIVTSGTPFGSFPQTVAEEILKAVSSGTGWVAIDPRNAGLLNKILPLNQTTKDEITISTFSQGKWEGQENHFITTGIPLSELPRSGYYPYDSIRGTVLVKSGGYPIVAVDTFEKGRIATFGYSSTHRHLIPSIDPYEVNFPYWEYYYSMLSKAILWTAGKEPQVAIESIQFSEDTVNRAEGGACHIKIRGLSISNAMVTGILRNRYYEEIKTWTQQIVLKGEDTNEISFPIPKNIENGLHFIDIIIRNPKGEVFDWGTAHFHVMGDVTATNFDTDREVYKPGDEIAVSYNIDNHKDEEYPISLSWELFDAYQRLIISQTRDEKLKPKSVNPMKIVLNVEHPLTTLYKLRIIISDSEGRLSTSMVPIFINKDWKDRYQDYMLGFFNDWQASHNRVAIDTMIKEIGIRSMVGAYHPEYWFRQLAEDNIGIMPENIFGLGSSYHNGIRDRSLSDPGFKEDLNRTVGDFAKKHRKYSILGYSIGEEISLGGSAGEGEVDFSTHSQSSFREWLKDKYRVIERLNEEWETDYPDWSDIKPITWKEAKIRDNPAPWVDFRTFMEEEWTGAFSEFRQAIQKEDPGAFTGYGASSSDLSPFSGFDYGRIARECNFIVEYAFYGGGQLAEWKMRILSSLSKGKLLAFMGYDHTPEEIRYQTWWLPIHGAHGANIFVPITAEQHKYWHYIYPTFAYTKNWEWLKGSIYDISHGVGKIFVESSREDDGIAIFHSQPSVHTSWIESKRTGNDSWRAYSNSRVLFQNLLKEMGIQFRYIIEDEVLSDEIKKYKVIFVPYAISISLPVLEKLSEFVYNGGMIVTDMRVGVTDEHGKHCKDNTIIKKMFGIERTNEECDFDITDVNISSLSNYAEFNRSNSKGAKITGRGKENLRLVTAESLAKHIDTTPAVTINRYGKGMAVYLNFMPFADKSSKNLIEGIINMAGITRKVEITRNGEESTGYESSRFKNGDLEYVAIQREPKLNASAENITVKFASQKYLYDIRNKKYMGYTDNVTGQYKSGDANVYALLPYEVKGLKINIEKTHAKPGEIVAYESNIITSKDQPGNHIFRIEVYIPEGQLCDAYTSNVVAKHGKYSGFIPLALNERLGKWRIKVIDVSTGKNTETGLVVE